MVFLGVSLFGLGVLDKGIHINYDYLYDVNGNMTQDLNKGIFDIKYNHLNLPVKIDFSQRKAFIKEITYRYDAT